MEPIKKLCADHAVWVKEIQELEYGDLKPHKHYWEKQLISTLSHPPLNIFEEIKALLIRIRSAQLKERLKSVEQEAQSVLQALEENPVVTQ